MTARFVYDRQLDSTSTDSNEWISKYRKAEHDRLVAVSDKERTERELRGQLSQVEQQLLQANTKLEQAEQQAKAAQAALTQEKLELQQRLQEAQARVVPPATTAATPGEQTATQHLLHTVSRVSRPMQ